MEFHARPLFEAEAFQLVPVSINEEQKPSSCDAWKGREKVSRRATRVGTIYVHTVDRKSGLAYLAFLQYFREDERHVDKTCFHK